MATSAVMSNNYNFKKIQVVPSSMDFIDIVLSKTQRKTPTVIHKNFKISRIRSFYMRKVKFTQDSFDEKLSRILEDFPKLDDIHPFYADLMNVLYDRDHYKLALGQINTAKHLIDNVGRDYTRLLKFGDSLYRCKQLKKAALGRMATIMKRQKETLAYLEQIRQHLARLPSIDPNTRTLLVCGYPNVGKSSFINKLTRAEVDVQPYAFTTKSLFVGHMDYKYLRWQVIDTPGILDHPLEERNTIEMLSITALAHLRACVLFFIDLTEQCGYSIEQQVNLFLSIKPLFANKPLVLVINKIDQRDLAALDENESACIEKIINNGVDYVQISCYSEIGLMEARDFACDKLLLSRVESKLKGLKGQNILDRIHVAQPMNRDDDERPPFIPEAIKKRMVSSDSTNSDRRKLERDIEAENGGAGVYNINLKKNYLLENEEWKNDIIPEIANGHNIYDFVDPEIEEKLEMLEFEEEELMKSGHYEENQILLDDEAKEIQKLAGQIRDKKKLIIQKHRMNKVHQNPSINYKIKSARRSVSEMSGSLSELGVETENLKNNDILRGRKRNRTSETEHSSQSMMDIDEDSSRKFLIKRARTASRLRDRSVMGIRDQKQKNISENILRKAQRPKNLLARAGEADRAIGTKMPKHLFAGKRGNGKTNRR